MDSRVTYSHSRHLSLSSAQESAKSTETIVPLQVQDYSVTLISRSMIGGPQLDAPQGKHARIQQMSRCSCSEGGVDECCLACSNHLRILHGCCCCDLEIWETGRVARVTLASVVQDSPSPWQRGDKRSQALKSLSGLARTRARSQCG